MGRADGTLYRAQDALCPKQNSRTPSVSQPSPGCFNILSETQTQTGTLRWCQGGLEGLEFAQLGEDWFPDEGLAESQGGR